MARTGSGKTLAYMIPLLQRFGAKHSTKFGPRALILCPGRELAVQILRVGKDMARGFKQNKTSRHAGDGDASDTNDADPHSSDLRWGLVVGGEGLDEQFSMIASNPDVIIATPGRLLHLIVEMNLDLRSIEYLVFDEADRLFEMGFEVQLHEILHRLPPTRQTLLFSATLPKSLVDFARAGLTNPKLVRLDAESKISSDLRMSFFSVKPADKEAALLSLLKEVIQVPIDLSQPDNLARNDLDDGEDDLRKREKRSYKDRGKPNGKLKPMASHQAIIFTATKHHVEYLSTLLQTAGYSTSHIYGSLDQTARKFQMDSFRRGLTNLLVVTDVAARGIDIPIMENVINYDFPTGSRVFVHRVGRTARAGRKGWAWSFVTTSELPYLLDLQLFLGRPLLPPTGYSGDDTDYSSSLIFGPLPRDSIDTENEHVSTTLAERAPTLKPLKDVVRKGQAMYERSQGKASQESYRRAKAMVKDPAWQLQGSLTAANRVHPIYEGVAARQHSEAGPHSASLAAARTAILARVSGFQPAETVFEMGTRGKSSIAAEIMKGRRKTLDHVVKKRRIQEEQSSGSALGESRVPTVADAAVPDQINSDIEMSDDDEELSEVSVVVYTSRL
jgi:ATP-dependent RNA helicase DDX54/DBP10